MTTKKTRDSKSSSVQSLGIDDLDQIVGGAAVQVTHHDPSQDPAFLATLGNVAAVVSNAATAVSTGHENVQTAITSVEAAAQAQHISTAAALTDLLGATHGNQQVATALTTGLINGSSEAELVNLAANGSLQVSDVANIVQVATGTLAAYSKDGASALGMSQNAAIDIIDSKIDTAAQTLISTDQQNVNAAVSQLFSGQATGNTLAELSNATHASMNAVSFADSFETQNAAQLTAAQSIINLEGGATAFQAALNHAAGGGLALQEQEASAFGETASIAAAFSGQANSALVDQILASSGVVNQLVQVAQDGMLGPANLSALENAAAQAHVSTDLTLEVAESVARTSSVQDTLATEMTSRLVSGAAETELAGLGATGSLQVQDINTIVSGVTGTLAGLSADGHSALGMSQNAAIDVIDSKIEAAAQTLISTDQQSLIAAENLEISSKGAGNSMMAMWTASNTLANAMNFAASFGSQNATQLTLAQSIANLEGGAAALQTGLNAVVGNPLEAQNASVFGETATIADAFAGHASSALVSDIIAASNATSGAAAIAMIEGVSNPQTSTDLALALADEFSTNKSVQQALDTELTARVNDGALVQQIASLAGQGDLQGGQDVTNIVSTVTNVLASHSADGNTVAGASLSTERDTIYANIDNLVQTDAANFGNLGNTLLALWNIPAAIQVYEESGVFARFAQALEISHGTEILTAIGSAIATTAAQADVQVQAAQQFGATSAIAQVVADVEIAGIEQTAQTSIQADLNQAQQVIESMESQAYNAAGGAATITSVSSSVQSSLNATLSNANTALDVGFSLALASNVGQAADSLVNSPTLSGFTNLGEAVGAHVIASQTANEVFLRHSSSIVLAAEGMEYLLGQSAVANVLGSHATGDLLTACQLVTTINNSIQLFASDVAQAGGAVATSVVSMDTDLAKNIGNLDQDVFTGNFSNIKADANQLASQFLTDTKALGSTIEAASSALVGQTVTILGNTLNSMYNIISANPDVQAAVSWVSTTGEKIGDVLNDAGGDIQNAASSTWNTVSNLGSDFASGVAEAADDAGHYLDPLNW